MSFSHRFFLKRLKLLSADRKKNVIFLGIWIFFFETKSLSFFWPLIFYFKEIVRYASKASRCRALLRIIIDESKWELHKYFDFPSSIEILWFSKNFFHLTLYLACFETSNTTVFYLLFFQQLVTEHNLTISLILK